jgi:hypothetical protein
VEEVLPPPPQATRDVAQAKVETTLRVMVLKGNVMLSFSGIRSGGCSFRLFTVGLWNN